MRIVNIFMAILYILGWAIGFCAFIYGVIKLRNLEKEEVKKHIKKNNYGSK